MRGRGINLLDRFRVKKPCMIKSINVNYSFGVKE